VGSPSATAALLPTDPVVSIHKHNHKPLKHGVREKFTLTFSGRVKECCLSPIFFIFHFKNYVLLSSIMTTGQLMLSAFWHADVTHNYSRKNGFVAAALLQTPSGSSYRPRPPLFRRCYFAACGGRPVSAQNGKRTEKTEGLTHHRKTPSADCGHCITC